MDGIDPFLIGGFSCLMCALLVLCATLYDYITTKRFNKYGIVTYGKVLGYERGEHYYSYGDHPTTALNSTDELYVQFELENQEHRAVIYTMLPSEKK